MAERAHGAAVAARDVGADSAPRRTEVLVLGSGAGGAVTAAILAERGYEVVVLEEGPNVDTSQMITNSPDAIATLYRNAGVTPILGSPNIAYVEGRCVGGSTEVNSAFWHRLPADCYHRWRADARLDDFSEAGMRPYFEMLERDLSVSYRETPHPPPSSELFRRGVEAMRWQFTEVPRCQKDGDGANPFAPGKKQSMQRTYIPRAIAAGVRVVADCRAVRLLHENGRVSGVRVEQGQGRAAQPFVVEAEHIFVCCGAVHTAALLRRSGITRNVGNNLCIHPMLKVAAVFENELAAAEDVLPIYQVKEFWPNIAIGGSVFTPGFLAMLLADNWSTLHQAMRDWNRTALYYTATRGMSRGSIRPLPGHAGDVIVRYRLTDADRANLSEGVARLGEILFAAGAKAIYPSLRSHPILTSADQCRGFLKAPVPARAMSLSTVHAFSSCPMGENPDVSATDSFGRVNGFRNLYVNDASLIPDSPGVNPQGTIMAVALRNLDAFDAKQRAGARGAHPAERGRPDVLVTGAPGWLGTRLVELLREGFPGIDGFDAAGPRRRLRCLIHPAADPTPLSAGAAAIDVVRGALPDPAAARAICANAAGATLFHIAGVIHPARGTEEFERVNVEGTRELVRAAIDAGVRRIVAVSSNSPFGFNPAPDHRFDERSPYQPYMGYGRSKQRMELLIREAQESGKIETVIIRPPWFYGPHQPPRQTLFFKMIREGRFPILGDGSQRRSMTYVDNLCQGLLLAAGSERANGQAYWIADERPYSILEIVETVRDLLEGEFRLPCASRQVHLPVIVGELARGIDGALQRFGIYNQRIHVLSEMGHSIACSIEKARSELGYAPRVSLRDGMRESIRWCIANGQHFS
jgi:nucleoside-diphosphate-sugar epimerase/choline dehydrogenase-like flavoprotein